MAAWPKAAPIWSCSSSKGSMRKCGPARRPRPETWTKLPNNCMERRMKRPLPFQACTYVIAAAFALGTCSEGGGDVPEADSEVGTIDVHLAMKDRIDAKGDAVWDIANRAIDDQGGIDAATMNDESWARLAEAAE